MDTFIDKLAQKRNAQEMIRANMTAETVKLEQMQSQMQAYDELLQEIRQVNLKTAENASEVQNALKACMDKLETVQLDEEKNASNAKALQEIKQLLEEKNTSNTKDLQEIKQLLEEKNTSDAKSLQEIKQFLEGKNTSDAKSLQEIKQFLEEKNTSDAKSLQEIKQLLEEKNASNAKSLQEIKQLLEEKNTSNVKTLQEIKQLVGEKNDSNMKTLQEIKQLLTEQFKQSDDFLHKENVKVYRNVQAAVVEELNKQTEELKKSQVQNRGSKAVLPICVLILLGVLANLAIQLIPIITVLNR